MLRSYTGAAASVLVLMAAQIQASQDTNGPNGINSAATGQTGAGIHIGQVESSRPGKPMSIGGFDSPLFSATNTKPVQVARRDVVITAAMANVTTSDHAQQVAGLMISQDAFFPGVAPNAQLHSSAFDEVPPAQPDAALSAQFIALQNDGDVRAINFSFGHPLSSGAVFDGNSLLTKFVDWSARNDETLYVVAGNEGMSKIGVPTDNYNGLTVAYSAKDPIDGVYRQVPVFNPATPAIFGNNFIADAEGPRTSTDLVAPGNSVTVIGLGGTTSSETGTSFAAPQVTGTVAHLQQFGEARLLSAGGPRWDEDFRRHEVMKAVLMNSADKIKDDGTLAPIGAFLGMDRTLMDSAGDTWLDSEAAAHGA